MKHFIAILLCGVIFSGCENFLDLEPETGLSTAIAVDNLTGADAVINGAYSIIHADWVERQWIFAETLANNVVQLNAINNTNYNASLNHASFLDMLDKANYLHQMSYQALHLVNTVLISLPDIETSTPEDKIWKRQLEGEALFLRGMLYHVLNRFFGQPQNGLSVIILTEPTNVSECSPSGGPIFPRATIEEVKAQVIADLLAADSKMDDLEGNSGRADKWSVKGMLARAYFEYGNYADAALYADQVINGPFELLMGDPLAGFQDLETSEHIMTFLGSAQDPAAQNMYLRYSELGNNVMLGVAPELWDLLGSESGDLRFELAFGELGGPGGDPVTKKYDNRLMHMPYIRLPEMYLTRAEALAETGDLDGGLSDLNTIRDRAELSDATYSDKQDLLDKIYSERARELAMEGDDFHNRRRLQLDIGGYPWNEAEYKLVFLMPSAEVDILCIQQNDPW